MATNLFSEFGKDVVYKPFLNEEFDVQQHTTQLVQGVIISEHLSKLNLGLSRVESEIERHVGEHFEELLAQAAGIDTLENSLALIQARTQTLQAGVERVRARIVEPHNKLDKNTLMLARLQSTCELLRRLIRCVAVTNRLKTELLNCPRDLAKAATSISELEELYSDGELRGIEVLAGSEKLANTARAEVEQQAKTLLMSGAATHNQTQVGGALQVFHNLNSLGSSVEAVVQELLTNLRTTITTTLDPAIIASAASPRPKGSGPGASVLPALGQTSQFRATLWTSLEQLMDAICSTVLHTHHLHKVLSKKRDPVTHVVFLDAVEQHCGRDLFSTVWQSITSDLTRYFTSAAQGSHFIRQALEVDYPKLVRLYGDLWRRLQGPAGEMLALRTSSFRAPTPADGGDAHLSKEGLWAKRSYRDEPDRKGPGAEGNQMEDPERLLRASLVPLEAAFLSRSLSRLFDPVNLMFSGPNTAPSRQECDVLIRTIASEVNVSSADGGLSESVARNVLKCVQLLCTKCEELMPAHGDAVQVIGPPTAQQQTVVATVNQLLYVRSQLDRALSASLSHLSLTPTAHSTLRSTVSAVETVMRAGVAPLFSSITTAIEDILLTAHEEDFSSNDTSSGGSGMPCSLYMRELQAFLSRAVADYISPFTSSNVIRDNVEKVARRCLQQFVWHACLVRPVGEGGKLRLAADFAQLEEAITTLVNRASDLGDAYRLLRAVRPLLFLTPQHMAQVSSIGELLPHSLILHLLFARAPPQLRSPHQSANWSVRQYLEWLERHELERERLELVAGALESYVTSVRRSGGTHYAPVYPVMMQVLEDGLKFVSAK